ncbi:hypothetical protein DQ398_002280 [Rossellomorea marisflavi]|nr:hypothetical protein DQ398_002280 [Rossellomorea marisflavi]
MTVRETDLLKAIQKLHPAEKHRLREFVIVSSSAGSTISARQSLLIRCYIGNRSLDHIYIYSKQFGTRE